MVSDMGSFCTKTLFKMSIFKLSCSELNKQVGSQHLWFVGKNFIYKYFIPFNVLDWVHNYGFFSPIHISRVVLWGHNHPMFLLTSMLVFVDPYIDVSIFNLIPLSFYGIIISIRAYYLFNSPTNLLTWKSIFCNFHLYFIYRWQTTNGLPLISVATKHL